jgi:tetrahydromethanopterin S-methyltransferase subunit H
VYQLGELKIGGRPGELPPVLVGNLFYKGMPEVSNHEEGRFDTQKILMWIQQADDYSEQSGVPHLLDIMAMYPTAMQKYISFVSEHSDRPFFVDGANLKTRLAGLKAIGELGLHEHAVFNGISPRTSQDELSALKDSKVDAAVLMAYNESDYSPEGRLTILEGSPESPGLIKIAKNSGIKKILIDTVVFDVPSIGFAAEATHLVKQKLGYPTGCSPANATYSWKEGLTDSILLKGFPSANSSAHAIVQFHGADFLIYGPIKQAMNVIISCAIVDSIITYYSTRRLETQPLGESHPLLKIFR